MRTKVFNKEVLYSDESVVKVNYQDIKQLKEQAELNERKRIRLCTHKNIEDRIHEMLIIHTKDIYVRPHKHIDKSESFHVIEGVADVVIFDPAGKVTEVIQMGGYSSTHTFYVRISSSNYHMLIIRSDFLVFHETTNGPFRKTDTIFAPWAPDEDNISAQKKFMENLELTVDNLKILISEANKR